MPRRKIINGDVGEHRNYNINKKYTYDQDQLDIIIDALEYYQELSEQDSTSDYVVFDITINIDETTKSQLFNGEYYDDGLEYVAFNPNSLKKVLPAENYYYRWTREFKTKYGMGEHYHLMVIANHFPPSQLRTIQEAVKNLDGVLTVFLSPRELEDDDPRGKIHFHWLNRDGVDGIDDAVTRHCYRAKLDQKLDGMKRSFDGSREMKPLLPVSSRKQQQFIAQHNVEFMF